MIKTQNNLVKARDALQTASSALARASDSATRAKFGAIVGTKNKAIAVNQQNIVEIGRSLNSLPGLRNLVSTVRGATVIHFRIYAETGETRLLLVDGAYVDQEVR